MIKYLSFLPILALSISLQAQTTNASGAAAAGAEAQTEHAAASAQEATSVSAELTKKIDTRNAKVGDEVLAKTTSSAKLADGTKLPRGTKLIGKVTEVQARSKADKTAHLAFELDHAVLRDGREVPVHAVLTSVTGLSAMAGSEDEMSAPPAAVGGGTQGGARAGSGVLGGVGGAAGGVVGGAANAAGNVGGAAQSSAGSVMNDTQAAGGAVSNVGAGGTLDHAPVAGLPGVSLSSSAESSSAGSFDAKNRNIDLESGTRMTMNVSAGQPGQQ